MPYYIRDPKRDHNFDNHLYAIDSLRLTCSSPVYAASRKGFRERFGSFVFLGRLRQSLMQASGGATESYRVSVVRYRDGCAMVVEFVAFFGFGPRACDLNCSGWAVVGAGGGGSVMF